MQPIIVNLNLISNKEKNPGPTPMHVDSSITIAAPCSQGNELVFGQNSRQICVARSLCSLIYNTRQRISSGHDLIDIINIGNQLYSGLSQLERQSYLMQTELPTMLNVSEADYQLEYSDSYSGTVDRDKIIEGYQYSRAFESLTSDGYTNFILTLGFIGVAIYCNMSTFWRLQLDMPGKKPKFTHICVLLFGILA